jgi:hypothetical protein
MKKARTAEHLQTGSTGDIQRDLIVLPEFLQTGDMPEKLAYLQKVWHHDVVNM